MKRWIARYAVLVGLASLWSNGVVRGAVITHDFTGKVASWSVSQPLGLSVSREDPVSGSLTYDTTAANINYPSGVGVYNDFQAGYFILNIGGITFSSACSEEALVANDYHNLVDIFQVSAYSNEGWSAGVYLRDYTHSALSSDSLPTSVSLNSFAWRYGEFGTSPNQMIYFSLDSLSARDASVTINPEPSTLIIWSLLGALGMAGGWYRRYALRRAGR